MRLSVIISVLLVALLCFGCSKTKPEKVTRKDIGQPGHRYALSGKVINENTGEVVPKFSVDIASKDSSVNALLNSLGSEDGLFHISRSIKTMDSSVAVLSLLITAVGYEPMVVRTEIGRDGEVSAPTSFPLKPLIHFGSTQQSSSLYYPSTLSLLMGTRGVKSIFQELIRNKKIDPLLADLLAKAKNRDVFNDILVVLNGNSSSKTEEILQSLLSQPLLSELQGNSEGLTTPISALLPYLQNYIPTLSAVHAPQKAGVNSFESILSAFLKLPTPAYSDWGRSEGKKDAFSRALDALQPLREGFQAREGDELGVLFNQVVKSAGIDGIKGIRSGKLYPFVESIQRGLVSTDAPYLTEVLNQIIAQADPAKTLVSLFATESKSRFARKVSVLYPAAAHLWQEGVVGKRVFAAQLLQGTFTGDFNLLKITQDLKTAPAVILSGSARDIFKIAQLPNVQKIFCLSK